LATGNIGSPLRVVHANGGAVASTLQQLPGGGQEVQLWQLNGSTWQQLPYSSPYSFPMTALQDGSLVVAGATSIERWDGAAWQFFAPDIGITLLETMSNGDVIAAGYFEAGPGAPSTGIARWDGSAWVAMGIGLHNVVPDYITAIAEQANGDIVVGGRFNYIGGIAADHVARWDGTSWSAIGPGVPYFVRDLVTVANGDIFIAGGTQHGCARWDGAAWQYMGGVWPAGSTIRAVVATPDGGVIAGGNFSIIGGVFVDHLARWRGGSWEAMGPVINDDVDALAPLPNGGVIVAGEFTQIGAASTAPVTVYRSLCPAAAIAEGSGCASSGGANVLEATTLPFVGATCVTRGSGLPADALVIAAFGWQQQAAPQPLAALLPQAAIGCDLHVVPAVLLLSVASNGVATVGIDLPNTLALAGNDLFEQMVPIELDALGNIQAITATNSLRLTVGAF
jgi:hypothetical protein